MRILARILSLPFALLLLVLGAFALLASYGGDTELADQTRRQLQALTRWSIDQGVGIPRDLASTLEDSVAGTFLRFVLLPGGLALLSFCIGLVGSGSLVSAKTATSESDDEESEAPRTDKKTAKKVIKQANALKKQGDPLEAADLLWNHDLFDEAAQVFIEGGEFVRAAESFGENHVGAGFDVHMRATNRFFDTHHAACIRTRDEDEIAGVLRLIGGLNLLAKILG